MKMVLYYLKSLIMVLLVCIPLAASETADAEKVEKLRKEYKWLAGQQLEVADDWKPHAWAWYSKPAAAGIRYDLSAGIKLDDTHPSRDHIILLSRQAGEVERFAAEELQKYLFRITGIYIPITTKKPEARKKAVISVGNQLDLRLKKKAEDEFVMLARTGTLTLSGAGDRGTLYSVYTFLEKYLGCRWYYPDPEDEIIPRTKLEGFDIVLAKGIDEMWQPAMSYRELMILNSDNGVEEAGKEPVETQLHTDEEREWIRNQLRRTVREIDWMAKNRLNTAMTEGSQAGKHILPENWDLVRTILPEVKKRGLKIGLGGHFWSPFLNTQTPGWPADNSWGPFYRNRRNRVTSRSRIFFCTTGHDAFRAFLRNVIGFFRANPEFDIWSAWPPDGGPWCECSTCSLFSVPYRCVKIHNQIAEALEQEAARPTSPIHGKKIPVILIGYSSWSKPPQKAIKPHPNFAIMPDIYNNFIKPYAAGPADAWKAYFAGYGNDNKLILFGRWTRNILIGYHLLPPSTLPKTIRNLISDGYCGVENFNGTGGWWVKGLVRYTTAKAMWDPDVSLSALTADYFASYFGPAAKPMRSFYEANERAHSACAGNFAYIRNYDCWYRYAPGPFPGLSPTRDKNFKGLVKFVDTMLAVSPVAKRYFIEAEKLAAGTPNSQRLLKRIDKARLSWKYYENQKLNHKYQFEGLRLLEEAHSESTNTAAYLAKLSDAEKAFEKAQKCFLRYLQFVKDYTLIRNDFSADEGVFWDGGTTQWGKQDYSRQWLDIVEKLRGRAEGKTWGTFPNERAWEQHYQYLLD